MNARELARRSREINEVLESHPHAGAVEFNDIWGVSPAYPDIESWCRGYQEFLRRTQHARDRD